MMKMMFGRALCASTIPPKPSRTARHARKDGIATMGVFLLLLWRLSPALRLDHDDTVGAIDAVDPGAGALQYLDRLDLVWIDTGQRAAGARRERQVVEDVERWGRFS